MDGLRCLTVHDIRQALNLSEAEGWNQTEKDWHLLITAPGNVALAFASDEKIIATATAMNYNNKLAWIGMVLVHREHRGKGLGSMILNELLLKLKSFREVKLDATPAGWPVYAKSGFLDEYKVFRMTLDADSSRVVRAAGKLSVVSYDSSHLEEVRKYDKNLTGVDRKHLFEYLAEEFPDLAFINKEQGKINGFVLGRAGARYYQAGPLMAESDHDAMQMLTELIGSRPGKPFVVDVPEDKTDFMNWLEEIGFQKQRHFVRMHLGEKNTSMITGKQFLTGGPEFG